jgi:hypothetical protein
MNLRTTLAFAAALLASIRSDAATQVSNLAESLGFEMTANGTNFAAASSFTTGASAYQLTSITVSVFTNTSGTSELRLHADNAGVPGTLIESLGSQTLPSNQGNVLLTFNSPGTPTLAANTTYWVTLGETGSGDFQWDGTFSTAETSPSSWTIGNQAKSKASGSSTWGEVFGGGTQESGRFAIDATAVVVLPQPDDVAVADYQHAIFRVQRATGNRTVLSGCTNGACSSTVGSGPPLDLPDGLIRRSDGSLVVCDDAAASVFVVDPVTGNRTVLSGCADEPCSSVVGTGIQLIDPTDAVEAGSSLLVADFRAGTGNGALLSVNPTTGNRTTLSGCADDACSSIVGSGRNFQGAASVLRNSSGELFVVDRPQLLSPGPAAVFKVDSATGNRTVLSGCIDAACTSIAGAGLQLSNPSGGSIQADGSLVVAVGAPNAVLRIDPVTGNRTVLSGCADVSCSIVVGTGPAFGFPVWAEVAGNGEILVSNGPTGGVFRVNPATGTRAVLSSNSVGTGPAFSTTIGLVELPESGRTAGLVAGIAALAMLARRRALRAR